MFVIKNAKGAYFTGFQYIGLGKLQEHWSTENLCFYQKREQAEEIIKILTEWCEIIELISI